MGLQLKDYIVSADIARQQKKWIDCMARSAREKE